MSDGAGIAEIPREVYELISVTYTDEGCAIWWTSHNAWLGGGRPNVMWRSPELRARVMAAAERLEGGFSG